ncbi:MAG: UDP-glucose 6-dehydrogenase [Hydrogenibacillus schlegelii]|uniref:UDP-glucose 6-dehydrogenase n=1 Tax=Hydrogenibacillus schlegelii TaxID=1484 RepID=A0A2T5G3P5_HYDSH|nr:MAG: UDP-glucose 6-dehydrogenase [Hydrogenibacillus schlegelii]
MTFVSDPYAAAEGADALLLATEWAEYRRLDLPRLRGLMRTPVFLDGRNVYAPEAVRAAGLMYLGVGR